MIKDNTELTGHYKNLEIIVTKMSQVPLSFCVPSGSVLPAALRLAHYFRIALFLGPIDYIMLCKYALSQR